MTDQQKSALRDNWWLLLLLVLCLAGAAGVYVRNGAGHDGNNPIEASAPVFSGQVNVDVEGEERAERRRQTVRDTISEYEQVYNANPDAAEAPAYLFAVGNLHSQRLQDYPEAIRYYELVVTEHADWDGIYKVFPQLISGYEQIGDQRGLRWICDVMMDHFPEGSQEYLFAQEKRAAL